MDHHETDYGRSVPRSTLEETRHNSVDVVLKDLKFCSRRLQTAFGAFSDEYKLLERLYYKGKNQHRGALFWRRVVEIRRFCDRLDNMQILNIVEVWRCSFFGESARSNPKQMRGPWTHLPELRLTKKSEAQLSACSALVKKMHMRLLDAYRSFTLAMQSGAFLQLLLTFAAVASRFGVICSELQEVFEATLFAMQRISCLSSSEIVPQKDSLALSTAGTSTSGDASVMVIDHSMAADESMPAYTQSAAVSRVVLDRSPAEVPAPKDSLRSRSDAARPKKKQKRQRTKDEIDEIFGL